jgi:hypothetical protein
MDTGSLVARCGRRLEDDLEAVAVDVPRMLVRLLLFETYTLQCSFRLRDVMTLTGTLGVEAVGLLLEEGGLRLSVDTTTLGYPTHTVGDVVKNPKHFNFVTVRISDQAEHLRTSIREIEAMPGFKHRKLSRLVRHVQRAIVQPASGEAFGRIALEGLKNDLDSHERVLDKAVEIELQRIGIRHAPPFTLTVEREDDGSFYIDVDFDAAVGLDEQAMRNLSGRAVVALGGLNVRLEQMQAFDSITAFNDADFALMDRKLAELLRGLGEEDRAEQLQRVVHLSGMPSLEDADLTSIDFEKFVALRSSSEMREFRSWLRRAAESSDEEILDRAADFRARLADVAKGTAGKVLRLAFTTAAGLIPGVGSVAGPGLGALDQFALDRLVGEVGPIAYFVRHYPSVFEGR